MSIPPVLPAKFYKAIVQGAKTLGISRAKFATDAVQHYLKSIAKKNAPITKALGSAELAKAYGAANSKIAKKWWSTVGDEERTARAKKAVEARWAKAKKDKK